MTHTRKFMAWGWLFKPASSKIHTKRKRKRPTARRTDIWTGRQTWMDGQTRGLTGKWVGGQREQWLTAYAGCRVQRGWREYRRWPAGWICCEHRHPLLLLRASCQCMPSRQSSAMVPVWQMHHIIHHSVATHHIIRHLVATHHINHHSVAIFGPNITAKVDWE